MRDTMAPVRQLGRYRLDRILGSGAFATVWKGYDPRLDTVVAIKVLADNWSVDADVRERFLTEARLLRQIRSPRVVRVHDVGVDPIDPALLVGPAPLGPDSSGADADSAGSDPRADRPYFVMDYVDGGTLAERIGHVSTSEAIYFVVEAAEAVQVLHDAGVVHRDIKPSNLLVDVTGDRPRVLVADLGSAKMLADATGITATTGTPAYMAPEQAGRRGGFDGRADVYALAVVSYELLAGRRPFETLSPTALMLRTSQVRPEPLTAMGLPARVDLVLAAGLDPDPERRPPQARAFAEALAAAANNPRPREPGRRDWPVPLVVGIAVVAFVVSALLTWWL